MTAKDYTALSDLDLSSKNDSIAAGMVSKTLCGNDLGLHMAQLANTASSTGRATAAELLRCWAKNPPTADPLHQAWAAWSLLFTGFWGIVEEVLLDLACTQGGREVLQRLVSASHIVPAGVGFMVLDMSEADLAQCRSILSGQQPWSDPEQILKPIIARYVAGVRSKGGWN